MSWRISWIGHVASMGRKKTFLAQTLKRNGHVEMDLKEQDGWIWARST
jgi:hypothetical protein